MGGILVKSASCVTSKEEQGNAVFGSLHGKSRLTRCTLLTRRSSSVLKVGVPGMRVAKLTKEDWPIVLQ